MDTLSKGPSLNSFFSVQNYKLVMKLVKVLVELVHERFSLNFPPSHNLRDRQPHGHRRHDLPKEKNQVSYEM